MKLYFDESTNSRLVKRFQDDSELVLISAYRKEFTNKENKERQSKLKSDVRKKGFGYIEFLSVWNEGGENSEERALLIPNMTLKDGLQLGNKYDQYSIIHKNVDGCKEYISSDKYGRNIGEEVQKFNTDGNFLNIETAKQIFSHKKQGGSSKAIKGPNAQPFNLKSEHFELYEVLEPRPSYFWDGERLVKIRLNQ